MGMLDIFKKKNNDDMMLDLPSNHEPPMPNDAPEVMNPFGDSSDDGFGSGPEPMDPFGNEPDSSTQNNMQSNAPQMQNPAGNPMPPPAPSPMDGNESMQQSADDMPSPGNYAQDASNDMSGMPGNSMIPPAPEPIQPLGSSGNSQYDRGNDDFSQQSMPSGPQSEPSNMQSPPDNGFGMQHDTDFNSPPQGDSQPSAEDMDVPDYPSFADKFGTKPSSEESGPQDLFIGEEGEDSFDSRAQPRQQQQQGIGQQPVQNQSAQNEGRASDDIDSILGMGKPADEDETDDRFTFGKASGQDTQKRFSADDETQRQPAYQPNDQLKDQSQENEVIDNNFGGLFDSSDMPEPSAADSEAADSEEEKNDDAPFMAEHEDKQDSQHTQVQAESEESQYETEMPYMRPRKPREDISGPVFCSMQNCEDMAVNIMSVRDSMKNTEQSISSLSENEKELSRLYTDWKKDIESIQSKLSAIDKKIFA